MPVLRGHDGLGLRLGVKRGAVRSAHPTALADTIEHVASQALGRASIALPRHIVLPGLGDRRGQEPEGEDFRRRLLADEIALTFGTSLGIAASAAVSAMLRSTAWAG